MDDHGFKYNWYTPNTYTTSLHNKSADNEVPLRGMRGTTLSYPAIVTITTETLYPRRLLP